MTEDRDKRRRFAWIIVNHSIKEGESNALCLLLNFDNENRVL